MSFHETTSEDAEVVSAITDPRFRKWAVQPGPGTRCFRAWAGNEMVGTITGFFEGYNDFHRLRHDEAELNLLYVATAWRKKAVASGLIAYASSMMHKGGIERLYAKVWRNNKPSTRAFERAGWEYDYLFVRLEPVLIGHPVNIQFTSHRIRVGNDLHDI